MQVITLVIYDITEDDLRLAVAKFLKAKGLKRVQKSAFAGPLSSSQRADVIAGLRKLVSGAKANVQLYPLSEASFRQRVTIGTEIDYEKEEPLLT
jgi:CRISPR-associated protein Cas2